MPPKKRPQTAKSRKKSIKVDDVALEPKDQSLIAAIEIDSLNREISIQSLMKPIEMMSFLV